MFDKIKKANKINNSIIQKKEKENEMNSFLNNSDIKNGNINFKKNIENIKIIIIIQLNNNFFLMIKRKSLKKYYLPLQQSKILFITMNYI